MKRTLFEAPAPTLPVSPNPLPGADLSAVPDPHREAFYAFERAARARHEPPNAADWSLRLCEQLIALAFETLGRQPDRPVVIDEGLGLATGRCRPTPDAIIIALPETRRRPWCALHEAAHAVNLGDGHGPAFASDTIRLWITLAWWQPAAELYALAKEHGVTLLVEETV